MTGILLRSGFCITRGVSHRTRKANEKNGKSIRLPVFCPSGNLLHALLIGLDHLLDHLAADGAGFAGGQLAVVAVGEVDANLPWCLYSLLNDSWFYDEKF